MLIFEGAFRKWLLPGLSDLFLLARDPICVAALMLGGAALGKSGWAKAFIWCGIFGFLLAVTAGHGSIPAGFYGLRIYVLHFPMIFLFPFFFDRNEVFKMAKWALFIAMPMTVLIGFQHYLPQTHWVNVGTGGVDSAGFGGALGRYRPPGTFSFITGPSMFYPMCAALLASLFLGGYRPMPKWIWGSAAAMMMALPLSISRTVGLGYFLVGVGTLASGAFSPKLLGRVLVIAVAVAVVGGFVTRTATFKDSMKAFEARWEGANEAEGGEEGATGAVRKRTIGWIGADIQRAFDQAPILGVGLGSGTSGGAKFISGKRGLNFGEGEWGIILFELGHLLGFVVIGLRLALAAHLLTGAARLARRGDGSALPLALLCAVWMVIGVSGQPTSLGFMVVGSGLCLALIARRPQQQRTMRAPMRSAVPARGSHSPLHASRLR